MERNLMQIHQMHLKFDSYNIRHSHKIAHFTNFQGINMQKINEGSK